MQPNFFKFTSGMTFQWVVILEKFVIIQKEFMANAEFLPKVKKYFVSQMLVS